MREAWCSLRGAPLGERPSETRLGELPFGTPLQGPSLGDLPSVTHSGEAACRKPLWEVAAGSSVGGSTLRDVPLGVHSCGPPRVEPTLRVLLGRTKLRETRR
jgi:hypothetical protein